MNKLHRPALLFILILFLKQSLFAGEGMWIPALLAKYNEADMIKKGLRITADDIYSINHASLKDAIVLFGRGCTGELVSDQGLLLTNHHCGYSSIQRHSTVDHDYLTDGFWAMSPADELHNPGLTVQFLIRMEDVTERIFAELTDQMTEPEKQQKIKEVSDQIISEATENTTYNASVKPLYYGNQYFLYVMETYKDVRLVGAPPSAIGKFGGDTDNWIWPRHTGDFSVFRIYSAPDGSPAEYSPDNIPLKPKKHFKISLKGVKEGDFSMVYGYPFTTKEYLPSVAVGLIQNEEYPVRIDLRTQRLKIMAAAMENDPATRIQYASKYAGVANGWKKWQGVIRGLKNAGTIDNKKAFEKKVQMQIVRHPGLAARYGDIYGNFDQVYAGFAPLNNWVTWFSESVWAIEAIRFARSFSSLEKFTENNDELQAGLEKLKKAGSNFFKDYNPEVDKKICATMLEDFSKNIKAEEQPEEFRELVNKFDGDFEKLTEYLFSKSVFDSESELNKFLSAYSVNKLKKLQRDPVYSLMNAFINYYSENIYLKMQAYQLQIDLLMRKYMALQMEIRKDELLYPDANATLRLTYGKVAGYSPGDGIQNRYYTTLKGIMEKDNPDVYDYDVPERLKELYKNKDYGRYGENGEMHVGFIAKNHTSGGNSGSPVLNADGHLIGINFDRNWEGTMSDFNYDQSVCRNISLDIRYCLFIIDKFAHAGYLVDEMDLVE